MSLIKDFLKKNPELLSKYVTLGFGLVNKTVNPINKLMQHLLEVQDIDPRTQPGERARKALAVAIDASPTDSEEYLEDFDFTAVKGLAKVNSRLQHLNLTREQFKKVTDLTHVSDAELKVAKAKQDLDAFLGRTAPSDPIDELREFVSKYNVSIDSGSVKKALETLKKYSSKWEKESKGSEKFDSNRAPVAVGRVKRSSGKPKVVKTFKKGVFRRINDDI